MFDALREAINFKGESDWESFKKWVREDGQSFNQWYFASSGTRLWNAWCNRQEAIERETLEKKFSYNGKMCRCNECGKKMSGDQFYSFDYKNIEGLRAYVRVPTGSGICKDCFEKGRAERKRLSEEHRKELRAQWYQDHKAEIRDRQRQRRSGSTEKDRAWRAAHREQINNHIRERKKADPVYKLKCQARTTIYKSFARTGNVKQERCEKLVGLSMDDFAAYLKRTYEQTYGIPWDGVDPVHIDHIIPLATAKSEDDVIRLCHYTNLQLLKAKDNLMKGSKYAESKTVEIRRERSTAD